MLKTPAMDSDEVVAFMRIFIAHHDGALASDFIPLSLSMVSPPEEAPTATEKRKFANAAGRWPALGLVGRSAFAVREVCSAC